VDLSAGLATTRSFDRTAFQIGGRFPRWVVRPTCREELCEILRQATSNGLAVIPWGGGVSLSRERAPERYDFAIDLGGLDRVVEYQPEDLTVTAECGVTIDTLRGLLAARRQELPLEAPHAARATLGGALAANASGPRRLRFGAPRDRILGARFVLGDGTLVRTGGKVVKNVAGYGIHRLLCGSRGGLATVVEASLKLMPAPETRVALLYLVRPSDLADARRWSFLPRLEPAFVTVLGGDLARTATPMVSALDDGSFAVIIGLEDDAAWAVRQAALVEDALGAPASRVEGDEALALAQHLADLEEQDAARLTFTTSANTPAAIAPVLDSKLAARLVFHAAAGRLHVFGGETHASIETLIARGFTPIGAASIPDLEPTAPMVATLRLRERIRRALDPARSMAFGDRWERGGF
jgi:FAD/FMN-containing dehydrogenase